ncbi:MAG: ABC transporter ATP-binding protein [Geminicoccaceae bacterium]
MSGHLLSVEDLAVEFHTATGTVHAVDGISYHLDRGETLAILGESGSGKSVSASAIMNLIDSPPGYITSGRVLFHGDDLLTMPAETRREINGKKIAMIFQDTLAHLNPVYSIGYQIAETFRAHDAGASTARQEAIALLGRVGIPDPARRVDDYPHQFSGGQRQRVMIAMALAFRPDILIADEPTTALDVTVQAQILKLLRELQQETGMGLILITHDLGVVAETADRVAVMHQGKIVETGPVRQVFHHPQHAYAQKLIAAIPGARGAPALTPDTQEAGLEGMPLLSVRGLAKHYVVTKGLMRRATGEVVRAVDGVSFDLEAGETLGIVGESGSGKSTLARTLLRLEEPTSGEALYRGQDIFSLRDQQLMNLRRQVQVVFQDPYASLNPRMTVAQIIAEPWAIHADVLPKNEWLARIGELLVQVGMHPEHARRYPHQFSGGQRQRIAIARALALQPEIIICDEAVSALDVSIQAQVIDLLGDLKSRLGLAYIFIAHDLPVIRDFANRVLVMHQGKIVEEGPTEQIFDHPGHPYTKALLAASPVPDPDQRATQPGPTPQSFDRSDR